jgi:uncharacterized protein (TIGR02453 family)
VAAGFFFRIQPAEVEVIGGAYMPDAGALTRIRRWIAAKPETLSRIIGAGRLRRSMGVLRGEQLQRVPREYGPDHPAAPLLRHKQWYFRASLPPRLLGSRRLEHELATRFEIMTPFVMALDRVLGNL